MDIHQFCKLKFQDWNNNENKINNYDCEYFFLFRTFVKYNFEKFSLKNLRLNFISATFSYCLLYLNLDILKFIILIKTLKILLTLLLYFSSRIAI